MNKKTNSGTPAKRRGAKGRKASWWQKADPHFKRESERYERPLPSREFLLSWLEEADGPIQLRKIITAFGFDDDEARAEQLSHRLKAMERDGQLHCNRRGGWAPVTRLDLVRGRIQAHRDGFGFFVPEQDGKDMYLSPREMRQVFHGDIVLASIKGQDRKGRLEGGIVEVIERSTPELAGHLRIEGKGSDAVAWVEPDNPRLLHDVLIPKHALNGAEDGQIVVVDIVEQPARRHRPTGKIKQTLGEHLAPGMEVEIALRNHNIPHDFPNAALEQAQTFGNQVPKKIEADRVDLRNVALITIDGEDAKDFDDAVFAEPTKNGWRLLVAIADVASYVTPDSPLDSEAFTRGTSVYFPNRVVPMLPEALSNGLCSLNPDVDRLCLVAEMQINRDGEVTSSKFFNGLMRSHFRFTYDRVWELLSGDPPSKSEQPRLDELHTLYDLFHALFAARQQRGAIDFDMPETHILFGENGKIDKIVARERNDAHKLIEECMIAANVAAAKFLAKAKLPTLYRVHPEPEDDSVTELREFMDDIGIKLGGGQRPRPKDYAKALKAANGRPDQSLIQTVLLRSLQQANYTPENAGHFGLAHAQYLHFTSPIRRYPDLLVHRGIKHVIANNRPGDFGWNMARMAEAGKHCSATERRADEATRDVADWLKCEFMQDEVGKCYEGVITGVTAFGVFVQLSHVFVEGLVHVSGLPGDFYHFEAASHSLVGERKGRRFRLGDALKVRVIDVRLDERKIDFELA